MQMPFALAEAVVFDRVNEEESAGTGDVNSDAVTLGPGQSVCFVAMLGAVTGVPALVAEGSDDAGVGDAWAELEGSQADGSDGTDDQILVVDVKRPQHKTVRCTLERPGSTAVDSILAIIYDQQELPVSQSAEVSAAVKVLAPAEGTA